MSRAKTPRTCPKCGNGTTTYRIGRRRQTVGEKRLAVESWFCPRCGERFRFHPLVPGQKAEYSPDRMDALVWAATELMERER